MNLKQIISCLLVLVALNTNAQTPRLAVTNGAVTINGKAIPYKATVEESFLPIDTVPAGSVITTTYEKQDANDANRPVIFLFNGGPGASSSPLHMHAFGPVRLEKTTDTTVQVNNAYSLLDVADMVFIDPMGTGFTRVFNDARARDFWDVENDARSVITIMKLWKQKHGRATSPVFICGESYGTIRAAEIMAVADSFPVKGVLLFASTLDFSLTAPVSGNEMPYPLALPSMAAIAWYHKKADPHIKTPQQAFNEAADFAKGEYLAALFKGNELDAKQKEVVATKLAAITGLSTKAVLDRNLRITTDDFEMLLLAKENRRIGKLNGQISAPLPKEAKPYSSRDDPSLVVNTIMRGDAVGRYFKQNLQFSDTSMYRGVNFDVNSKWKWTSMDAYLGYYSVLPGLENAMQADPKIKLLVAGGLYDLATPLYAAKYLFSQSSIPAERITFLSFPTGHSIFDNEAELAKLSAAVKEFVGK